MAELTEEQKQKRRDNLAKARAARKSRATAAPSGDADGADGALLSASVAELDQFLAEARPVLDDAAAERRRRLLADLDPEIAALVSDEQLAQIEAEERAKAKATRVAQALKDARAVAHQQALIENDLIPADRLRSEAEKRRMMEPVTFEVHVPSGGAGDPRRAPAGFTVDGFRYQNGRRYTRPRHIFESLQEMHYRVHLAEVRFSTLNQQEKGNSAPEVLARTIPRFEVA